MHPESDPLSGTKGDSGITLEFDSFSTQCVKLTDSNQNKTGPALTQHQGAHGVVTVLSPVERSRSSACTSGTCQSRSNSGQLLGDRLGSDSGQSFNSGLVLSLGGSCASLASNCSVWSSASVDSSVSARSFSHLQPTAATSSGGLRGLHAVLDEVINCGFYHGAIGQREAKTVLSGKREGTFILRDSSDERYLLSISVSTASGVTSVRVAGKPSAYYLDCHESLRQRFPKFISPLLLVAYFIELSSEANQKKCVWLDASGRRHATMKLLRPLYDCVPSLKHAARFAILKRTAKFMVAELDE